jgi:acyl phosphate:glycerol-3-phosphate acyltransferase
VAWIGYILTIVASYLLGSIPTGYLAGRVKGIDIRQVGSGNIGATNVFRALGKTAGITVLALDAFKGFSACWWVAPLAYQSLVEPETTNPNVRLYLMILAGLAAVSGHVFSCWLRFKGGKGIATTAGIFGALAWKAVVLTVALWIIIVMLSRYVSLASIAAAIWLPIMVWLTSGNPLLLALTVIISVLALYKHKTNIQRLLQGTEHRFSFKRTSDHPK